MTTMSYEPGKPVDLDKLRSLSISVVATPSRNQKAASAALWHDANERDVPAYKRLRANGVQPPSVHGSAWLEANADTVEQVEGSPAPAPEDYV